MSSSNDQPQVAEEKHTAEPANETADQRYSAARRTLLKAGWVAPVIFSLAADQASAQAMTGRRR